MKGPQYRYGGDVTLTQLEDFTSGYAMPLHPQEIEKNVFPFLFFNLTLKKMKIPI
jgi:hypothetical protein